MKTGLLMVANDAYMSSPKEMRIEPIIGCPDWYLCPAKPGAVEKMIGMQEEVFTALAPIDVFNIFPADPDRKRKIQATLATLENTAPEWVKRDWRWQEIVTACATKSR